MFIVCARHHARLAHWCHWTRKTVSSCPCVAYSLMCKAENEHTVKEDDIADGEQQGPMGMCDMIAKSELIKQIWWYAQ